MKKLCQIAIYENNVIKYLENHLRTLEVNQSFEFPCNAQCEVLEFNSIEDFNNLINLVSLESVNITITQEDLNQFGSLREAAKSKLIGVE